MNGRSQYRKTGSADAFWARERDRIDHPPLADPNTRLTLCDFVEVEANGVTAFFTAIETDTGFVFGRCHWKDKPAEHVELPFGINLHNPQTRADFHKELLIAVRAYARTIMKGEIEK